MLIGWGRSLATTQLTHRSRRTQMTRASPPSVCPEVRRAGRATGDSYWHLRCPPAQCAPSADAMLSRIPPAAQTGPAGRPWAGRGWTWPRPGRTTFATRPGPEPALPACVWMAVLAAGVEFTSELPSPAGCRRAGSACGCGRRRRASLRARASLSTSRSSTRSGTTALQAATRVLSWRMSSGSGGLPCSCGTPPPTSPQAPTIGAPPPPPPAETQGGLPARARARHHPPSTRSSGRSFRPASRVVAAPAGLPAKGLCLLCGGAGGRWRWSWTRPTRPQTGVGPTSGAGGPGRRRLRRPYFCCSAGPRCCQP